MLSIFSLKSFETKQLQVQLILGIMALKALLKFVSENIGAKKSDGRKTVFKNNFALDDEILAIITYFSLINILFSDI